MALVATMAVVAPLLVAIDLFHARILRSWLPPTPVAEVSAVALAAGVVVVTLALLCSAEYLGWRLLSWADRRVRCLPGLWNAALLCALVALPALHRLAWLPFEGTRYRASSAALYGPWILLPCLVGGALLGFWLVAWTLRSLSADNSSWILRTGLIACALTLASASTAVDATWEVAWYPVLHSVLAILTIVALQAAAMGVLFATRRLGRAAAIASVVVLPVGAGLFGVGALTANQTAVWLVSTGTLYAGRVVTPWLAWNARDLPSMLEALPDDGAADTGTSPPETHTTAAAATEVLLFMGDTLRADVIGAYGADASNTPDLDRFFSDGVVFERAYAQYAATRHSVRTLFESRFKHAERPSDAESENLIGVLRDHGYTPLAVLPEDVRLFTSLTRYNFADLEFYDDPAGMLDAFKRLLARNEARKRFLWVHAYSPHAPYTPPSRLVLGQGVQARYVGEVRWLDEQFTDVVAELGPSDTRLVIFGSDHGEELGDRGGTRHGHSVYDEILRVPLMLEGPGVTPARVATPVANIDIAPTILAALGLPIPELFDGYDLRSLPVPDGRWIFGESVTNRIMVVRGPHKWTVDTRTGLEEYYNLDLDPRELRNRVDDAPAAAMEARQRAFLAWFQSEGRRWLAAASRDELTRLLTQAADSTQRMPALARCAILAEAAQRWSSAAELERDLQHAAFSEPDPVCRLRLVASLGHGGSQVPDWGCRSAESIGPDLPARLDRERLRLLGRCPNGAAELRLAVGSPLPHTRGTAAEALGEFPDAQEVLRALVAAPPDWRTLEGALRGLGRQAPEDAGLLGGASLNHPQPRVRAAAAALFAMRPTPNYDDVLRTSFHDEKSPLVRASLIRAASQIDKSLGRQLLRQEVEAPLLSQEERVRLILAGDDPEVADHLLELLFKAPSVDLQRTILRGLPAFVRDKERLREIKEEILRRLSDTELRTIARRMTEVTRPPE